MKQQMKRLKIKGNTREKNERYSYRINGPEPIPYFSEPICFVTWSQLKRAGYARADVCRSLMVLGNARIVQGVPSQEGLEITQPDWERLRKNVELTRGEDSGSMCAGAWL